MPFFSINSLPFSIQTFLSRSSTGTTLTFSMETLVIFRSSKLLYSAIVLSSKDGTRVFSNPISDIKVWSWKYFSCSFQNLNQEIKPCKTYDFCFTHVYELSFPTAINVRCSFRKDKRTPCLYILKLSFNYFSFRFFQLFSNLLPNIDLKIWNHYTLLSSFWKTFTFLI